MSGLTLIEYVVNAYLKKANEVFAVDGEEESVKWRYLASFIKECGKAAIEDGKCVLTLTHPETKEEEKVIIELDMECQVLNTFLNNLKSEVNVNGELD